MSSHSLGLAIAVIANTLTGISFVIKKQGLDRCDQSHTWWAGFITMVVGEIGNFAAYAYAPAILVTPLGHVGMFLCALGTGLIVTFAPEELPIVNMVFGLFLSGSLVAVGVMLYAEYHYSLGLKYILFYIMLCSGLPPFVCIPFRRACVIVVGALCVLGIKGLGIAIVATLEGHNQFSFRLENRLTYVCVVLVVLCLLSQVESVA